MIYGKIGHIRASCKKSSTRGRFKSKGPARRTRSQSKLGVRPPPKTQVVWVQKSKTTADTVIKDPPLILQTNQDLEVVKPGGQVNAIDAIKDLTSEKSNQEIDPLVWQEVQHKKKKK